LFVKAEKYEFHSSTISFLGYIIVEGMFRWMSTVLDWPQPTSRVQLQRFMEFAHFYHSFIPSNSNVAVPISALTSPKVPFI
jgi:hypothetical protein